jgi:uncharacterized secreted repeat protein (TIGR03808 family)
MKTKNPTTRRQFIAMVGASATILASSSRVHSEQLLSFGIGESILDVAEFGLQPNTGSDVSKEFQAAVDRADLEGKILFLPSGNYLISSVDIPGRLVMRGVPGMTKLIYSGNGQFLRSRGSQLLNLSDLILDGNNLPLDDSFRALLYIDEAKNVVITNCSFIGSRERGIHVERSSGSIEACHIEGAMGRCAIFALDNVGLSIRNNVIKNCSNNGILVHRSFKGEDSTLITGNRIKGIAAANGGTGEWGNGINIFRSGSVIVSNNMISDCALSAIRSNAGNNVQITSNQCLRSGETAIYSEFDFEGAIISNNMIDDAGDGISMANFMQGGRLGICSNNIVRNIADRVPYTEVEETAGTGISVEADTIVNSNIVENSAGTAIAIGWGPYLRNVVATSNIIRRARLGVYVSVVESSGSTTISNNVISECKEGAIVGHRWRERVTSDLLLNYDNSFPHLTIHGNKLG